MFAVSVAVCCVRISENRRDTMMVVQKHVIGQQTQTSGQIVHTTVDRWMKDGRIER